MSKRELAALIEENSINISPEILETASNLREKYYGKKVYMRGLIEFTNYCKNDCFYCGIRKSNKDVRRYRIDKNEILACCENGYGLGYRTFVLQGGEDPYFSTDLMCDIISSIREKYPECAITLSLGEHSKSTYQRFFESGANRYLLRHETASEEHYKMLHPSSLSLEHRKECLFALKEIGFQVGAGFMVGSPFQTYENLAEDLLFIKELNPHMVGIGPFIPSAGTPFADYPQGSLNMTVLMLSLTRIMLPRVLLPSTTALGTIDPLGREKGLKAGGNVVMPNLSPTSVRKDYALYDNKICTGDEAAECRRCIERRISSAGLEVEMGRGDIVGWEAQ